MHGIGCGTGNGADTIGNNGSWSLSLSRTSANISAPIDCIPGPCPLPGSIPVQCKYTFSLNGNHSRCPNKTKVLHLHKPTRERIEYSNLNLGVCHDFSSLPNFRFHCRYLRLETCSSIWRVYYWFTVKPTLPQMDFKMKLLLGRAGYQSPMGPVSLVSSRFDWLIFPLILKTIKGQLAISNESTRINCPF